MPNQVKRILLINLTRMGDILQSTPLLKALKQRHPSAEIHYLAVAGFSWICEHIPEIDRLIPFDFNAAVAVSKDAIKILPRRIQELDIYLKELEKDDYDLIINLSHSRHSAIMAYLINGRQTSGLTLSAEGYRLIKHPWARYFFIANLNRHYNRFNLVDINQGLSLDTTEQNQDLPLPFGKHSLSFKRKPDGEAEAEQLFGAWKQQGFDTVIGLQPGASLDCKRWPVQSFIELAQALIDDANAGIVVFGTQKENHLAEQVCAPIGDRALNLAGKTSISGLGSSLARIDLLITNDTGTQHVAAAVGTPVLSLCFGSALSHETGPFGTDHVIVESNLSCYPCSFHVKCNDYRCQQVVTPAAVKAVALDMLSARPLGVAHFEDDALFNNINVWRTDFDRDGFWLLRPLIRRQLQTGDAISLVARKIWKDVLTSPAETVSQENDLELGGFKRILSDFNAPEPESFYRELYDTLQALRQLVEMARSGQQHCRTIQTAAAGHRSDLDKVKAAGDEIEKLDKEISTLGFRLPAVNHLVLNFTFQKQNLQGNNLVELTRNTAHNYLTLQQIAEAFLELLYKLDELFVEMKSGASAEDWRPVIMPSTVPLADANPLRPASTQ